MHFLFVLFSFFFPFFILVENRNTHFSIFYHLKLLFIRKLKLKWRFEQRWDSYMEVKIYMKIVFHVTSTLKQIKCETVLWIVSVFIINVFNLKDGTCSPVVLPKESKWAVFYVRSYPLMTAFRNIHRSLQSCRKLSLQTWNLVF